jgi:NAD(P)-dependent dehydrogenase (short-subunit alcohol dehydrogenase family)
MRVVLADIDGAGLARAQERISERGVDTLTVVTDVADETSVQHLADETLTRFGAVHLVCNNAGVGSFADPWFGPMSQWQWVLGVNLFGVVHGVRAFLPTLLAQGEGHIVNTASMAGLIPGAGAAYDASKHAVVAISEDLYGTMRQLDVAVGVSVLCPGWVRTNILDAERNWPATLGEKPPSSPITEVVRRHAQRAIDEGMTPAAVADVVADAVIEDRFWIFPHPDWVEEFALQRWQSIADGLNPEPAGDLPGLPPAAQLADEIATALGLST